MLSMCRSHKDLFGVQMSVPVNTRINTRLWAVPQSVKQNKMRGKNGCAKNRGTRHAYGKEGSIDLS